VAGPRLLAITPPVGPAPVGIVDVWRGAGAEQVVVLLRRPGATVAAQLADAALQGVAAEAMGLGWPVLVSCAADDADGPTQAAAAGLAGVQLRGDPDGTAVARARAAGLRWVGASVHGLPTASAAAGADFVVFAPVFAPATPDPRGRPKAPAGLAALRQWTAQRPSVVALGGIDAHTAASAVEAGACGLASIRSFFGPPGQVGDNVGALVDALRRR
jgi:thiamine monophosphate synthase